MPPLLILATFALVIAQITLPKRWAFVPLFIAVFHLADRGLISQFTPVRLVFIVGIIRCIADGSFSFSPGKNKVDLLVLLFGIWAMFTAPFHTESEFNPYTERAGLCLNVMGTYLYGRAYLVGQNILPDLSKALLYIMIPFAVMMAVEATTGDNYYKALGSRSGLAMSRGEDGLRAKGPFGHSIIAGTTGACLLPLMVYYRKRKKLLGTLGIAATTVITFASNSSGPMAAFGVSLVLLFFWRWRHLLRNAKIMILLALIFLNFTMSRPVWFLIARIDLAGGSTGWHRSKLIDQAIRYLDQWWLFGTDYTRHWMFSGVSFSRNHTDITNYYLQFGVWGGLPLMILFIMIIYSCLRKLEVKMESLRPEGNLEEFGIWCIWACIISQCASFLSIAYFDQTYALIFTIIGMTPALLAIQNNSPESNLGPPNSRAAVFAGHPDRNIHS